MTRAHLELAREELLQRGHQRRHAGVGDGRAAREAQLPQPARKRGGGPGCKGAVYRTCVCVWGAAGCALGVGGGCAFVCGAE